MTDTLTLIGGNLRGLPLVIIALLLVFLDGLYAVVRHVMGRRQEDELPLLAYLEGRVTIVFVVAVGALIDQLVPDVPLLDGVAIFYIVVSAANILDAGARDGVPIPDILTTAIRMVRSLTSHTTTPAQSPPAGRPPV